ncbi:Cilia- and flagella-associated protein 43 [Gaertneriomyces sp. JEL0708]|nr:Cilia- and flagella-associated protein 43 [Gaertneriomyces sp. JEL0708]
MPGGLYGDLEVIKTVGHTPLSPPAFLTSTIFGYIAGNSINFVDTSKEPSDPNYVRTISTATQVTAFALNGKDNIVAYAERDSESIRLVKYPSGAAVGSLAYRNFNDVAITAIAFSSEGQFVAALGSLPTFSITVWEWQNGTGTLVCAAEGKIPANHLSFDPLNSRRLCTSGGDDTVGGIKFWTVEMGYKSNSLKAVAGAPPPHTLHGPPPYPTSHTWTIDSQVLCTTSTIDALVHYDPATGECRNLVAADGEPAQHTGEDESGKFVKGSLNCAVVARDGIFIGGKDGEIRFFNWASHSISKKIEIASHEPLHNLIFSPTYTTLLVQTSSQLYTYSLASSTVTPCIPTTPPPTSLSLIRSNNMLLTASQTGCVTFWDVETRRKVYEMKVEGKLTAISASPFAPLVAVGSSLGVVRVYWAADVGVEGEREATPRLVMRTRVFNGPITKLSFDPSGRYLSAISMSTHCYLFEVFQNFALIGYIPHPQPITSLSWTLEEDPTVSLLLYILTTTPATSFIHRYAIPLDHPIRGAGEDGFLITKTEVPVSVYRIDDVLVDFTSVPRHLAAGRERFYGLSMDKKVKAYQGPIGKLGEDKGGHEIVVLGACVYESLDHQKPLSSIMMTSTEWLLTHSTDGCLTLRTLMEPEKILRVYTHDPDLGGCAAAVASRDARVIVTAGHDGLLRFWEWRYNPQGRRAATEASGIADRLLEAQREVGIEVEGYLQDFIQEREGGVPDIQDTSDEPLPLSQQHRQDSVAELNPNQMMTDLQTRLTSLRDRLAKLIAKNSALPELEQLTKPEMVIDWEERDRLLAEMERKVEEIRRGIEDENVGKRIIAERIKQECWDSMEVPGGCLKSFGPDPLTGQTTVVTNFPLRKQNEEEIHELEKVKLMRKTQLMFLERTTKPVQKPTSVDDEVPVNVETAPPVDYNDIKSLLYSPYELTTPERRRTQLILLSAVIRQIKQGYNGQFGNYLQQKHNAISSIEEKGERCKSIMNELGIQEHIPLPKLDDEEIPERVIEARDEEVTVTKFITEEERKKIEERKRIDEERARLNKEDNARERALLSMMNGTLSERGEGDDRQAVTKPAFMDAKPSEEWSEEEKKLAKEYEKKLATLKEESEKARKALETELRKLQTSITETMDNFDSQTIRQTLMPLKLATLLSVHTHELTQLKLYASILYSTEDEAKERAIANKLDELKNLRLQYSAEIPEIKKDLERCREDYELAVRKDKDVEKAFKKEFHGLDNLFDTAHKMFRKRDVLEGTSNILQSTDDNLNPYLPYVRSPSAAPHHHAAFISQGILAPISASDIPELPHAQFQKLAELRDKKIATEADLRVAQNKLADMQNLVQSVLEASEKIRVETERLTEEMRQFMEYRFRETYDLEVLVSLKQGQVEVPQSPLITDYSPTVLLHRSVIENLNSQILALGGQKLTSLHDIKTYRKGIHALEWENSMLFFQAESLQIRTRDIHLLRVTKQMQEYIRGGDERKHIQEVQMLERRGEWGQRAWGHKLEERDKVMRDLAKKIQEKRRGNEDLKKRIAEEQDKVRELGGLVTEDGPHPARKTALPSIYARRRLMDLAKSQAHDITILREEVQRMRMKTYPSFPARRPEF